jgi:hypothetical protein
VTVVWFTPAKSGMLMLSVARHRRAWIETGLTFTTETTNDSIVNAVATLSYSA